MKPERVTTAPAANEQLLYFTSSSLLANDSRLVYISDRTGHPNLWMRDLISGSDTLLTDNAEGFLKSYVYFDGAPYKGFGKASVSLHPASGTVYYIQGTEIRKIEADGNIRTLTQYPAGQMTGFTHVSADGKFLCVPTTDERALQGDELLPGRPEYDIDYRVRSEGLASYLRVFDTATGGEVLCERVPNCWITHVQFCPTNSNLILYNHEWASDCGIRRMWLFDGARHIRLRTEGDGRSRTDWTCHEMWERDGSAIIYHGTLASGHLYIGRVNPDGTGVREIALPAGYKRYGHFTVGDTNMLVSDGCYEEDGDRPAEGGDWISLVHVNWATGMARWFPLCRSLSSWKSQDEHPHPIFDHSLRYAYFTSDMDGKRAVYRIAVNHALSTSAALLP